MKKIFASVLLFLSLSTVAHAQKLVGYNGFDFGMSKETALFICDVRDYFIDTNYTYDAEARIPPTLSESFIYYLDSIEINGDTLPLDVTLYFDNYNGNKLFNVDVSIKYPLEKLSSSKSYFNTILELMKEKYGRNYRYTDYTDTVRIVNDLFKRKFYIYDWDMDNGRVSLEYDVSSFYRLDEDFYYTDELKENGFLEITIFYFDTDMYYRFMNSKGKLEEIEKDGIKKKL